MMHLGADRAELSPTRQKGRMIMRLYIYMYIYMIYEDSGDQWGVGPTIFCDDLGIQEPHIGDLPEI